MKISPKKAIVYLFILSLIGVITVFSLTSEKNGDSYVTAFVESADLTQTVNETGTVKAVNELDLSLMNSGEIAKINYRIGDKVKQGDILLELDYSGLVISREEAAANLTVARENLKKLLAGAVNEDIEIAKANVSQAKTAYDAAVNDLERTKESVELSIAQTQKALDDLESKTSADVTTSEQAVSSAEKTLKSTKETYQKAVDNASDAGLTTVNDKLVVANKALDVIYTTLNNDDAEDYIGVKSPGSKGEAEQARKDTLKILERVNTNFKIAQASPTNTNVLTIISEGLMVLNEAFDALELTFTALDNSLTTASFSQTALDSLKSSITAQQTLIAGAISAQQTAKQNLENAILAYDTNVTSAENNLDQAQAAYDSAVISASNALDSARVNGEQQISSAKARVNSAQEAWQVAQAQLNKITAPPNRHDRSLLEARVSQAEATLLNVNKQIENSIIKSPINGTVTKVNYEIGEQVVSGSRALMSVLGENDFEIEVMVSEADIAKVEEGDDAEITLDSYGDDIKFKGSVTFIEPAETVIQDVVYYKVDINFIPNEKAIKSGMTANVIITTDHKENVLAIPTRAIISRNGSEKIVRVLEGGELVEKQVTVGLRGDEGLAEIIGGLNKGDEVVTYINKE